MVHNPELFDSRSWLRITNDVGWPAYRALEIELEAKPRNNRAYEIGATIPKKVAVQDERVPTTSPVEYDSMTQAVRRHGRRVRTSLASGKAVRGVRAWLVAKEA